MAGLASNTHPDDITAVAVVMAAQEAPDMSTPLYILVLVTLFSGIIFVIGVLGNAIVMCIILRNHGMHSSTNMSLFSLSVADIMVLVICMPSALSEFYGKEVWYLGQFMCK